MVGSFSGLISTDGGNDGGKGPGNKKNYCSLSFVFMFLFMCGVFYSLYMYFGRYGCVSMHMTALGYMWMYLEEYGCIWVYMDILGCAFNNLGVYDCEFGVPVWLYLDSCSQVR